MGTFFIKLIMGLGNLLKIPIDENDNLKIIISFMLALSVLYTVYVVYCKTWKYQSSAMFLFALVFTVSSEFSITSYYSQLTGRE